jgi:hypothetical protein
MLTNGTVSQIARVVRMGIHSGPVNAITDLNEQARCRARF